MATEDPATLTATRRAVLVKHHALDLGFADVGITDLAPVPHGEALDRWLAAGMAGTMRYLHRQAAKRKEPSRIMPEATRVIVVLYNYAHDDPPPRPGCGKVARYARGADYHTALAAALDDLATYTCSLGPPTSRARWFVDAGPVPERELAQRAGLGWIGKNTMLISPQRGSFTFLATVLTNVDLAADAPFAPDRCGSCTRCLEACPTQAFPEPRVLDATRCISYLTIEYRGEIPSQLAGEMDNWVFGCDICQDVCPWNEKFARPNATPIVALTPDRASVPLDEFAGLDEPRFAARHGWTPLERPGLAGMRRNAAIAARNAERRSRAGTDG
jgi:epoxyqueuosine reductase